MTAVSFPFAAASGLSTAGSGRATTSLDELQLAPLRNMFLHLQVEQASACWGWVGVKGNLNRQAEARPTYCVIELVPFAGGVRAGFSPPATSFTTWAASLPLTGHSPSFTRHCESVSLQPHVQLSEFKRRRARFFCSAVKPLKLTPGNSVALAAFLRNTCPVSTKVSTRAFVGMPSSVRISRSYASIGYNPLCFCTTRPCVSIRNEVGNAGTPP